MGKRVVLGRGIDSIFEVTTPATAPEETAGKKGEVKEFIKIVKTPKFKTFEVKLSVLLRQDQLDLLTELERKIMRSRSSRNKKERITKNTIIRVCLDVCKELEFDVREIRDEAELLKRMKEALYRCRNSG